MSALKMQVMPRLAHSRFVHHMGFDPKPLTPPCVCRWTKKCSAVNLLSETKKWPEDDCFRWTEQRVLSRVVIYIHSNTKTNNMGQSVGARPVVYFGSLLWVFFCSSFFFVFTLTRASVLPRLFHLPKTKEDMDKLSVS